MPVLYKLLSLVKLLIVFGLVGLSAGPGAAPLAPGAPGSGAPGRSLPALDGSASQRTLPFWALASPWADSVLAGMSTEEKLGQLFMVAAYSNKGPEHEAELATLIREQHIGGLIWFQGGPLRQVNRNNRLQALSKVPMLVGMDAEWGPSMRLDSTVLYPRQLSLGAVSDDRVVYRFGAEAARQLKLLGVHVSFSPVIDINNNPLNPVIGDRSFGEDPMNVALKGLAYMEGLQHNGILACGKHFPGHGDTDADSHLELPVIAQNWARLDSVELYPFRLLMSQGLASVMTAHLHIPSLDNRKNRAASISASITSSLLRDSLGFGGLAFTDALNMKGVSSHFAPGALEVEAFMAGNDILLFPEDVPAAMRALTKAISEGQISMADLDARVRRILQAKAWVGLDRYAPTPVEGLAAALNNEQALWARREILEQRLTLLRNADSVLPFKTGRKPELLLLDLGRSTASAFQTQLQEFGPFPSLVLPDGSAAASYTAALNQAAGHDAVVVGLHGMTRSAKQSFGISEAERTFIQQLSQKTRVILVMFGSPYAVQNFSYVPQLMCAYDEQVEGQQAAARALFGQLPIRGRLPVSAGASFPSGTGLDLAATRLKPSVPEQEFFAAAAVARIDSIVERALGLGAAPGCRVLVARHGNVFVDRAYGLHSYPGQLRVRHDDLYDLASITKVAATTLAVMKLYDDGKFRLDATVADYLPEFADKAIAGLRMEAILTHSAGLQPWIPFYRYTLTSDKTLNEAYYRSAPEGDFNVAIAEGIWMHRGWQDSIWRRIADAPLLPKAEYKYSDLGFYLLARIAERLSGQPLDEFVQKQFYQPMGLESIGFNPLNRLPTERIVPTERDVYYRHQLVDGYVHDMGAAMMGGVAGHAGLFSTAGELAALFQMLLNGGTYGGHRLLKSETVALFTERRSSDSRRGLGFDKPETDRRKISPASVLASPYAYGHSGFTGTIVWADPQYNLIYIFLSNRVYPDQDNRVLISENVRTRIQDEIYRSLRQGAWDLPSAAHDTVAKP